jgi:hypothetical protein
MKWKPKLTPKLTPKQKQKRPRGGAVPPPPPPPDYSPLSIALRQRDDAIKQLNDRANIDQTLKHLHNSLGELHSAMQKIREFARIINGLSAYGSDRPL